MATETEAENNNKAVELVIPTSGPAFAGLCIALGTVLRAAGLELPQHFVTYVGHLAAAMNRFSGNSKLWDKQDELEARTTLQKHLCFTLIVPAGRADRARTAVDNLAAAAIIPYRHIGVKAPGVPLDDADVYDTELYKRVFAAIRFHARFPQQKAIRVTKALMEWDSKILQSLPLSGKGAENKAQMVRCVINGMGPKATAHFMRNTGLMSGLDVIPIIDTHIIKLLVALGYVYEDENPSYKGYSEKYMRLARKEGIPPLLLDAVAWSAYANNWDTSASDFDNFKS